VNETIGQLIEMIETSILEEVKKHHQATQINSTNSVETLRQRTTLAVEKHEGASADDRNYVACARSLEQCHSDHKCCVDVEITKDGVRNESCTTSRGKQHYTSSDSPAIIDLPVLVCDFAQPRSECKYDDWKASLARWADERIAPEVNLTREEYLNAKRICDSDTQDHSTHKERCEGKKSECNDRELNCDELERKRDVSMCIFGDRLRSKCEAKSENELLASNINGTGSVHSDSDRRYEWISGLLIKCMLMEHRQGADFDEATMTKCQGTASYDDEVGILDLEHEAVGQLTSAEKFDCVQNAINFSGVEVVKTPGSPYPAFNFNSPFTSTVSLDPVTAPFDVCASSGGEATCANFNCTRPKSGASTLKCALSSGCTKSECFEE